MMNVSQARVIDPILTQAIQGYKHPERVGHTLFPKVDVGVRGGTVLKFGPDGFRLYNARRAPGADTVNLSFGYEGEAFKLVQDALNSPVPRELLDDAKAVPGVDIGLRSTATIMRMLTLALEDEQARLATDPANYDADHKLALAGTAKWSHADSDPIGDIEDAKEKVRLTAGVDPNRMVISTPVFRALKGHPKVIDRFKYTSSTSITTAMLANLLDLDVLAVGKAAILTAAEDDAPFTDVWGNNAVLAYAPNAPSGLEEPSFGYTYTLKGHPFVEPPFWDNSKKSWVYGVTYERQPVLTGIAAGFLFTGVA